MIEYVEKRNGGFYLAGSRVSLDSVVISFQQGASPESILRSFPAIGSLEKVYGAVTFYLANKQLVEDYLRQQSQLWDGPKRSRNLCLKPCGRRWKAHAQV